MLLYIVRHGETDWNKAGKVQGRTDIPLNERGRYLAEETAKGMKNIRIDFGYTSPLIRAKETAQIILGDRNVPLMEDERIEELCFGRMKEQFSLENDIRVSTLSRCPEVLTMEEQVIDEEELWNGLKEALESAFRQFVEMRTKEGERLKKDILSKLDFLSGQITFIEQRSPQIVAEYKEKLEEKMRELLSDTQIDDNRIAAEVILFADKICTDEEVVRLKSHIQHMKETLDESNGIGRKLDFIAQEMNREANTILSKANDLEVSNCAISLKTEIEKIREQIQNIE